MSTDAMFADLPHTAALESKTDIERTGMALHLRWLWFSRTDLNHAWSGLDLQFTANKQVLFFASLFWNIRTGGWRSFGRTVGSTAGFSVREIAPLLYACIPKRQRKLRTVDDSLKAHSWARNIHGIHEIAKYLLLWWQI
jgi:hypothetical protein